MNNQHNNQYSPQSQTGQSMLLPSPIPQTMGRIARWNKRLMSGVAANITTLPSWFATSAIVTYFVALIGVNFIYSAYTTEWYFWVFGIAWVVGFFLLSVHFSRIWNITHIRSNKVFEKCLFWTGGIIRAIYVAIIYNFYVSMTGQPHEFGAADSIGYIETAEWISQQWSMDNLWETIQLLASSSFSDLGFPLYVLLPVHWFGEVAVFVILLINSLFSAYTAILIYRLTRRSMPETTARIAAIFCMLHPVLICYCGMTLKEVFMTWLLILFVDLTDRMLVGKSYSFVTIAPVVLVGIALFTFRTVLGMVAFMAIFFSLVMIDTKFVGWGKKVILGVIMAGAVLFAASDNIMREINKVRNTDFRQEQANSLKYRYGSEKGGKLSGNRFANYAGAAVFAPLIFTIPFPTMVDIGSQEDMRLIHGGNWMRNVMSGFVILAMFMLLLSGDWRKYTMPLAMMLGYLVVLVFSSFAHSLRFHIPVMPLEMMFAAYAITNMRKKHRDWYLVWCIFMVVACFGWNWMKLRGRGL